jgi:hypothetical protein
MYGYGYNRNDDTLIKEVIFYINSKSRSNWCLPWRQVQTIIVVINLI